MAALTRLKYAAFLLVVAVMATSPVAALIGNFALVETLFSPWFALPAFVVSWLVAPRLSERLPFKRGE